MALDPRTPVLVGAGQITNRPDPAVPLDRRPEPLELMIRSLRAAAEDCDGTPVGGAAGPGDRLLRRADSLAVVGSFGWPAPNPGLLVAEALGSTPGELLLTGTGGNSPQALLHRAARAIGRGDMEVALVVGAEGMYTRLAARRPDHPVRLTWTHQPAEGTPAPVHLGHDREPATPTEVARGIELPIQAYPLIENAIRVARGWSVEEHRAQIGRLWSQFSTVAAGNPHAWLTEPVTPEAVVTPSPANRMIAFPYPKLCTANLPVDQGAAYICCSVAAARAAGVPEDRWVFPLAGAEAQDHWFLSERPELHASPAIRLAGRTALALAGTGPDQLELVDLYSCFPAAVQIAADELGLAQADPDRPLTLTGGLTFSGGPGNNYTTHGIAAMVTGLRQRPGALGLTSGLGWYATKHAIGVYGTRPPDHEGRDGFRWEDLQAAVDALPTCPVDDVATGPATVETYTVTYDRDGRPDLGILACRTGEGVRTWVNLTDPDDLQALATTEGIGRRGLLDGAGGFRFD